MSKIGRNDPCPCGSGKKYKQCCFHRAASAAAAPNAELLWRAGNAHLAGGALDMALSCYREAVRLRPGFAQAHYNLGVVFQQKGLLDEAAASFRSAISFNRDYAKAYNNLGYILATQGRLDESADCFNRAIAIEPGFAAAYHNLGTTLRHQGRVDETLAAFRTAHAINPHDPVFHSDLLMMLHYSDMDDEALFREHVRWGEQHAPAAASVPARQCDRDPGRKLRIGYVSGDLGKHPVGYFLLPLLESHDRSQFEICCYSERGQRQEDDVTARIRGHADLWRRTMGLGDAALAEMIRADGIDILVDLAGHTAHNRLKVFALKPAPAQVTWLGYPNTTGLRAMDYRITDAVADPPGSADALHTEQLIRLEQSFLCYTPPAGAPPVGEAPCLTGAGVTFGSFNNLAKVSPQVIDAWSAILGRVPGSRLMLKFKGFADETCRRRVSDAFGARGVSPDRLELVSFVENFNDHLALYNRLDLALDTFPYNGTATTCDALWMGVPVLTCCGTRHVARVGASILTCLGLPELITHSPEEYIAAAAALAADPARLAALRRDMRPRLAGSPLCDSAGFARRMETALRDIWRRWCSA
ncbi:MULTISPECIES: tetratricopeptide repeat protein [Geobacter]|uniref:protein O-GlcNAc transferase n=2 Tax=Geobacter TaxID=28231 RepID=A0A0C1QTI5_9BACT|nr:MULTISPECIES: tetratricopeptide repeat protein [Geobacter]ANA39750.1 hypothetical protein A2G06_04575 [Geobacter anodireducens]KIE41546.1 hypothetical protein SE37_02315 [Geobacter soli]MBE2888146.1 tetratricopeptide repeat protein [Geobacter anodireducens]